MQLRFSNPFAFRISDSGFKQSISAVLTGVTVAGAFSTVIFNSKIANEHASEALESVIRTIENSTLYEGVKQVSTTLKNWGQAIVTNKDDFKEWLSKYLGPDGFKSGVVNLYEKLRDWVELVYRWFKDRFLEFVGNIPKMVENWRKLRLSLFKWGTFLGGGGGAALWAMFGDGSNWGKLGELMGNPKFAEIAEKFGKLMENNSDTFSSMSEDEAQAIFEKVLENPEEAEESIDELLKQQEQENQDSEKKKELTKDQIMEEFNSAGGGSPKDPEGVFTNMVSDALQKLSSFSEKNSWDSSPDAFALKGVRDYLDQIKDEVKKGIRKSEVKKEFLDTIKDEESAFVSSLVSIASKAFRNLRAKQKDKIEFTELVEEFGNVLEKDLTVEASDGEEGVAIRQFLPAKPRKKK